MAAETKLPDGTLVSVLLANINVKSSEPASSAGTGEIIYRSDVQKLYVNTGTAGAPAWAEVGSGGGGSDIQSMDDIPDGINYVKTENNYTDSEKTKLAGVETGATADLSASEILALLKTVDGSGSGLNADLLDGYSYESFAWKSHSHSYLPLAGGALSGNLSMGTHDLLFSSGSVKMSDDTGISGAIEFTSGASNYIQRQYVGNNYVQVYNMDRQHSFSVTGSEKLRIDASQVELFSKLNANGQTIEKANIAGTEATAFMLNQDLPESSAGVNGAFKVNRGASGTEARLLWDEGGNKWCCDADGVYCPLQVSRLYLSSDTYLYKDGSGNLVLHAGTGGVKFE